MAFLTGIFLIDAPASALNNAGAIDGERTDNTVAVKYIHTKGGAYPYVSAQAFRYWVRNSVERVANFEFSPIQRETKIAYTAANPIQYWDDDIMGYMRAAKGGGDSLTRISPFRTSTLVSICPIQLTNDFGTFSRLDNNPVPYEHQFYRTTLKGVISLDLYSTGLFWASKRTGFRNLDDERIKEAEAQKLEKIEIKNSIGYRLTSDERFGRIEGLLKGLSNLEGGAKLTQHYTDVLPSFIIVAVVKGGNNIFQNLINADTKGSPILQTNCLKEILNVYQDAVLSPLYIGWPKGYLDDQREKVEEVLKNAQGITYYIQHPRDIMKQITEDLRGNPSCLGESSQLQKFKVPVAN